MITEWQKAWMAGVFDFQAHVQKKNNYQRAPGSQQIVIYIDTGIDGIINRLGEMTGSNVESKERRRPHPEWMRKGCGEHCPEAHIHVAEGVEMPPTGRWTVTGAAAAIVLWNIRPYLTTDREPWDWALATCLAQVRLTGRGAAAVARTVIRLHDLGWDLPPMMEQLLPPAPLEEAG